VVFPTPTTPIPSGAAERMIRVESQLIQQLMPAVAIGEIVKVTVRQNGADGQGLIGFRGNALKAALPPNLAPGDQYLAKVDLQGEKIILKLLDAVRTTPAPQATRIANGLQQLASVPGAGTLRAPQPFNLNSTPEAPPNVERGLHQLMNALGSTTELADPGVAMNKLLGAATGQIAETLRETAELIRKLAPPAGQTSPLEHFLRELRTITTKQMPPNEAARALNSLIKNISEQLDRKNLRGEEQQALGNLLKDLTNLLEKPEQLSAALAKYVSNSAAKSNLERPEKAGNELQQIAARLEQLAATQESLGQLNPLMQAIGEPALILLPFMASGLLTHSEVAVDWKHDEAQGNAGRAGGYQRLQLAVPLPNLGRVDVDVAYRGDEMLIRMHVAEAEAAEFLEKHLPELRQILATRGYARTEIRTSVGTSPDPLSIWPTQLGSETSIRA
jgi:hypothetical protein